MKEKTKNDLVYLEKIIEKLIILLISNKRGNQSKLRNATVVVCTCTLLDISLQAKNIYKYITDTYHAIPNKYI